MPEAHQTSSFEQSIQLFDDKLRVRWGSTINQWVIDRKAYVPATEVTFLQRRHARFIRWANEEPADTPKHKKLKGMLAEIAEEIASAKDGRRVVLYAASLDRRIFDMLVAADMQRFGGYSRFADELEKLDKQREEHADRQVENRFSDVNREVFDQMDFIERKRQTELAERRSMKDMLTSGVKPSVAKKQEGFTVIDRRAVKPEDVALGA